MNCQDASEFMMKDFDGELNDIEHAQLKQHLKTCKSCSISYESMVGIFETLKVEGEIEPPANFEASVMNRLKTAEEARRRRTERILFAVYSLATITFGILTFIFVINMQDVILKSLAPAATHSGFVKGIYFLIDKFYYVTDIVIKGFKQLTMIVSNIYYYLIAAFTIAYLIIRPGVFCNRHEGKKES